MGLMNEYIDEYIAKGKGAAEFEQELLRLIAEYNKHTGRYLFIYSTDMDKHIPNAVLEMGDYYIIYDQLCSKKTFPNLDFYIQTPGGSGEAAEEIVRFLHSNFSNIRYVVSGEAKSAGTIIVLSGHEILMTETASLGPIDAQVPVGRSVQSAYDYMEWVNSKRDEAGNTGALNPFDAVMIAQITPGELSGVNHSLNFAKDLVVEWLPEHKFKDWHHTETTGKEVTDEMKRKRAREIADELCNHSRWRSHGRSLKIADLLEMKLKVIPIDDDPKLAEIVYRIHTVTTLLFLNTTIFKIFATASDKIFKHATTGPMIANPPQKFNVIEMDQPCPSCNKVHRLYAKLTDEPGLDEQMRKQNREPFPKDGKLKCDCGFEIDLSGVKNEVETRTGQKLVI